MPSPSLPISRHISPSSRYQELLVVPSSTIKQPAAVDFFDERRWRALEADSLPVSPPVSPMHLPMYLPVSGSTGGPGTLEAEHVFFYPN